jgi:tRNA pseudouridine32 synthase/23S rRNA pseudouridine746 synthase
MMSRPTPREAVDVRRPLPTRDGVGPSVVALPPEMGSTETWPTIAEFLVNHFPAVGEATWLRRMQAGDVVDEHGAPVTPQRAYQPNLRVYYYRAIDVEPRIPFDEVLLFQDEHLVAVDKPHFLPVTPGGRFLQETLLVRLKRRLGIDTLAPVHRIDRETAGVVLFSVQPSERGAYQGVFSRRTATKHYEAVVPWRDGLALPLPLTHRSRLVPDSHFLRMQEAAGEPNSETRIELLERRGDLARLRLSPVTGRKHQLRVHCAALALPILHDQMYPTLMAEGSDDFARPLQLLATTLAFDDPVTGEARRFASVRSLSPLGIGS